ncbi:hypothetical protein H0H93_014780, partial [Arthromyces matolae]
MGLPAPKVTRAWTLTSLPVNWADDYEIERAASIERVKSAEIGEMPEWKEKYPDMIWKPSNRTLSDTDVPVSVPALANDPKLKEIRGRIEQSQEKGRQIHEELLRIMKEREERNLRIQELEQERIAEMDKILEESEALEGLTAYTNVPGTTNVVENPYTVTEPSTPVVEPVNGKLKKGKSFDPKNWGNLELAEEELSVGQQEQLLTHFEEVHSKFPKFESPKYKVPGLQKVEASKARVEVSSGLSDVEAPPGLSKVGVLPGMSKVKVSDDRTDLKPKSEEVTPKKVRVQSKPPGDSDDGSSDDSGPESDQGEDSDKPK